ncbi:hypothetical protein ES703_61518 [subsurface metagenome]
MVAASSASHSRVAVVGVTSATSSAGATWITGVASTSSHIQMVGVLKSRAHSTLLPAVSHRSSELLGWASNDGPGTLVSRSNSARFSVRNTPPTPVTGATVTVAVRFNLSTVTASPASNPKSPVSITSIVPIASESLPATVMVPTTLVPLA